MYDFRIKSEMCKLFIASFILLVVMVWCTWHNFIWYITVVCQWLAAVLWFSLGFLLVPSIPPPIKLTLTLTHSWIYDTHNLNYVIKPGNLYSDNFESGMAWVRHNVCKIPNKKQLFWCFNFLLLAHLAKGNVSFCHHLASVVCHPLTFHILIFSSETP